MRLYKFFAIVAVLFFLSEKAAASHISGGEIFYEYIGPGLAPNTAQYRISVRLFRECSSNGQDLNSEVVNIGIFSTATRLLYTTAVLDKVWSNDPPVIRNTPGAIPCLVGDGSLCYQVGVFTGLVELPQTPDGFTLSWVRCCRQEVTNVFNHPYPDSAQGSTFITHIPGTDILPNGFNNSPQFVVKDTALICAGKPFTLDFSAFDTDHDSLAYSFCDAYLGGTPDLPNPPPKSELEETPLPYLNPYSGGSPLGSTVIIKEETGIISGIAPAIPGKYVVNVCVQEFRKGVLINVHHKDFILKIANCDFASAQLKPSYLTCDGYGTAFENLSTSSQIQSYFWDFGVPGMTSDTSVSPTPYFNYPDTGTYKVKLVVNKGGRCGDSTTAIAKIYPGFKVNFGFTLQCPQYGVSFVDSSTTKYGIISERLWDFGDGVSTSTDKNPVFTYANSGQKTVKLVASSSKGCIDSIAKQLVITEKLVVSVPVKDTFVCNLDTLKLVARTSVKSIITWLPAQNILDANTLTPRVYPTTTTTYKIVAVDTIGCKDSASIVVNAITLPTVNTIPDTAICSGQVITLATSGSNGNRYQWKPVNGMVSAATAISPQVSPGTTTLYSVIARNDHGCVATDSVNVTVNISPTVKASADSTICLDGKANITAVSSNAIRYDWWPADGLDNISSPLVVASPAATTAYGIKVTDVNGCNGFDTVVISVIPKPVFGITPGYKNICRGDTLALVATGGDVYRWYPADGANNAAATAQVHPDSTTNYAVIIDNHTCNVSDTLQARVIVIQPFALSVSKLNDVDCFARTSRLQATGGANYVWRPANTLNNAYSASPVASPLTSTMYYVSATNGNGCIQRDSVMVNVITSNVQNGYLLPSAFTPNGDQVNDCFGVKDWGGIKSILLSVYNRWGQLVFSTSSPSGCWDGTLSGRPQPPGTYVYQVKAETVCGSVYRKGTLVLIR